MSDLRGVEAVHKVIARVWDRRGEPPIYGSSEWAALDPADPRWMAAIMRAAECWRLDGTQQGITEQLDHEHRVAARRLRLASYDLSAGWPAVHASLARARAASRARAAADAGMAVVA